MLIVDFSLFFCMILFFFLILSRNSHCEKLLSSCNIPCQFQQLSCLQMEQRYDFKFIFMVFNQNIRTNSVDPEQTPQHAAFDNSLHYLPLV